MELSEPRPRFNTRCTSEVGEVEKPTGRKRVSR